MFATLDPGSSPGLPSFTLCVAHTHIFVLTKMDAIFLRRPVSYYDNYYGTLLFFINQCATKCVYPLKNVGPRYKWYTNVVCLLGTTHPRKPGNVRRCSHLSFTLNSQYGKYIIIIIIPTGNSECFNCDEYSIFIE